MPFFFLSTFQSFPSTAPQCTTPRHTSSALNIQSAMSVLVFLQSNVQSGSEACLHALEDLDVVMYVRQRSKNIQGLR